MGPSFLDLQLITNVDVVKGSAFYTASSVGNVLGSFLGGVALDMFNKKIVLFFLMISTGAITASIPWCINYWWMIIFQALRGMGFASAASGINALTSNIWRNRVRQYMQMVHFCYALGGVVSPLATKPYLTSVHENATYMYNGEDHTKGDISFHNRTLSTNLTTHLQTSLLYIPYSVSGVLVLFSAIPLLYDWFSDGRHLRRPEITCKQAVNTNNLPILPTFLKLVALFFIGLLFWLHCSVEGATPGFLATFVVQQLNWSKQKGAELTSVFWATFATARFTGIFVAKILHSSKMIFLCCIFITMSCVGLYLGAIFHNGPMIWLFTGIFGVSTSFSFPCLFTWTEEDIVAVTAKISSFYLIMGSFGGSVTPLLIGYFMDKYTPLSFLYILFSESVVLFVTLVIFWLIVKLKIKPITPRLRKTHTVVENNINGKEEMLLTNTTQETVPG